MLVLSFCRQKCSAFFSRSRLPAQLYQALVELVSSARLHVLALDASEWHRTYILRRHASTALRVRARRELPQLQQALVLLFLAQRLLLFLA
jgi:hypothetical protein